MDFFARLRPGFSCPLGRFFCFSEKVNILFFLFHFNFRFFLNGTGEPIERSRKDEDQGFTRMSLPLVH